ncbi:MAG: peptidylprolyl isomerase [Leptolyngbyaceae cyanobacterium MO_188.B28]|nr:peptidylprolyl isomerase [Leptolyngbyaceae cyanobacterium MO_188.B28]
MTPILQVGDRTIMTQEIVPMLKSYSLLPQFLQGVIIDQTIASVESTDEEIAIARQQFLEKNQLTTEEACHAWMNQRGLSPVQLDELALQDFKLLKYKVNTWGHQLESYFLQRKGQLDRVLYSLIRVQNPGLAQELYFRIQDDGQPFSEVAKDYSQGQEAQTGGLIGPVELNVPHPTLSRMLAISKPGQLWAPTQVGEWYVILRLEKFLAAQLDEAMRQRLLNEMFASWLQESLQKTPVHYLPERDYSRV